MELSLSATQTKEKHCAQHPKRKQYDEITSWHVDTFADDVSGDKHAALATAKIRHLREVILLFMREHRCYILHLADSTCACRGSHSASNVHG